MHDHIHSIQVQSLELLYVVFFYSIESFYITWNCFWITAYKTSNNILQISCCEFEYFSINKRYTSRRRQRNERTQIAERAGANLGRIHSWKYRHLQQSTYPWEVFSADLFAIFQSNLLGQLHVVQPPSSDGSFRVVPRIWIRLWSSCDPLSFSEN